jgi:hypothetical protein
MAEYETTALFSVLAKNTQRFRSNSVSAKATIFEKKKNQSEIVFVKVFANFREIRTSSAKVMGCTRQKQEIPMVGQPRTLTLKS